MSSVPSVNRPAVFDSARAGDNRILVTSLLASLVGVAAGFAAYGLYSLITVVSNVVFYHRWSFEHADAANHILGGWVVLVPVLGGLIVGLMAKYGSPKIRGHGIPEAMEAVLFNRSRIAPQVALLKPASVAVAIGTGGPFGAEGPIIQTGGALGSMLGQTFHVTAAERKVLLASGAAAGMAATFSTPIAAVILAIELLLFEYRPRSFIPLVIASTLATAVRFVLMGRGAMFTVGAVEFGFPGSLPWYLPLGILCGLAAAGFSKALYWIEDQFERLPVDELWWPAIGGLGLGAIALFVPRVLGVGYGTISDVLNARLALDVLAVIMIAKAAALLVSLGSGTSGGLLAPMFTVGAALGGLYAGTVNHLWPAAHLSLSAFALVAMAAVFGAAARAPFTFIIFAFELTRDYESVLPLMIVVVVAHGIALKLMPNSIMTEKLARRGLRVHQEYEVDPLHQITVAATMDSQPPTIRGEMKTGELAERIAAHDQQLTRHQALLVVDERGELAGILTRGDLVRALERDPSGTTEVAAAATRDVRVAFPDETVHDAVLRMLENHCGRLPVVSRDNPRRIVGYLGRTSVLEVRLRRLHEDRVREPGWLKRAAVLRAGD
ncbi:VWA containing CoxE-like protein [Opitutaceae bacterium EW11]|nr:VWA containing CoxE-like protein [Opitutaceae bacterium EW11]